MKLTGEQARRIHSTILSSYTRSTLSMALRFKMNVALDEIVPDAPFSEQVLDLIDWAEHQDRVVELVDALHEENPGSSALAALAADAQDSDVANAATVQPAVLVAQTEDPG